MFGTRIIGLVSTPLSLLIHRLMHVHVLCHVLISLVFLYSIIHGGVTRLAAAEDFVTVDGRYLKLVSDHRDVDALNTWVQAFDQAVPQWMSYLGQDVSSLDGWRMTGYLMVNRESFRVAGLIPSSLPPFPNGYNLDDRLWVLRQPSDYYSLHLILHEGVHGLTQHLFGGSGAPWYMEGLAEYLGTHRRTDGAIQVGVIPASRDASPYWGRIGLIADRRRERKVPTIETVMRYGDTAHRDVEPYAWSWCATWLMEMYPEYQMVYRAALKDGRDSTPQFTRAVFQQLREQWPVLVARWRLLVLDMDYGIDVERHRVELEKQTDALGERKINMSVLADRGWQCAPTRVKAGQVIDVAATGFIQLETDAKWMSTADGVTITYHRGQPLGRLLACCVSDAPSNKPNDAPVIVQSIGANGQVVAEVDGWLLFRINDYPNGLADNTGQLEIRVKASSSRQDHSR